MNVMQDVFISHASRDKEEYILPLIHALSAKNVTYWLDAAEIRWGDSFVGKINEGLRTSRRLLVCLSENFLKMRWPKLEMDSAFAQQADSGETRVLPLILNSQEDVLAAYPLLRSLNFRLFEQGVESIAEDLAALREGAGGGRKGLHIRIESAHSGRLCDVIESPAVSVEWLASKARAALGGKETAKTGAIASFQIRWILVDVKAESRWREMTETDQRKIWALAKVGDGFRAARKGIVTLEKLGVRDGTVSHLYGIALGNVMLMADPPGGTGGSVIA